jgi:hypothetical protein
MEDNQQPPRSTPKYRDNNMVLTSYRAAPNQVLNCEPILATDGSSATELPHYYA